MTLLLLIATIVEFLIIILLSRYIWYIVFYGMYINLVKEYIFIDKKEAEDKYWEYISVWPFKSVMARFWNFKFRSFVVNQDLYDKVLLYIIDKYKK